MGKVNLTQFLTTKYRHLWRHHYFGTQGIIFLFGSQNSTGAEKYITVSNNLRQETISVLKEQVLFDVPVLLVFDKNNGDNESSNEKLRTQLLEIEGVINTQYVNFSEGMEELYFGIDWLVDNMKAL